MTTATIPNVTLATLHQIENELRQDLFERDEAIRASLVAIISKSHLVLLGPPGTAKSLLCTTIADRFCDPKGLGLSYFVYLLTRFTTPEELFGPVSVHGLKNDTYERITTNKLPKAQLAFLDEVFKTSSAVLNSLLELLNNRVFDNGTTRESVPLISLFGASNEMPQGDDLEALWDRFLLRLQVGYLAEGSFEKLLQTSVNGNAPSTRTTMSQTDLAILQTQAEALPIPDSILASLATLRRELEKEKGIIASDRRWVQSLRILQAHALIEGRDAVEEDDLSILAHVLWSEPQERAEIARKVSKLANPINAKATELKDAATSVWEEAKGKLKQQNRDDQATARAQITLEALSKIKKAIKELEALKAQAKSETRPTKRVDQALQAVNAMKKEIIESNEF